MEGASFSSRSMGYKTVSNDAVPVVATNQKSLTPILDRFKALLRDREEEIRVSVGGGDEIEVPPPSTEEIVELYELVLSELTINSKPIITDLTIIAGEQREHGEGIADAICRRIIEVPVEQKLPSLYLLDSIVKNIGREYMRHFSARLPEVFCEAYRQVHPNLYPSMRHLFGTWSTVFPSSVLRKIEAQLQLSPSSSYQSSGLRASESPRPAHGIHVNPKYLEARRQLERSTADSKIQHARAPSTSKILGKPAVGFDEYEYDNGEVISTHVGTQILGSTSRVDRTPFGVGHARASSPAIDEFATDDSPRRFVEGASPSHHGFGYRPGGVIVRDEDVSDWRRPQLTDGTSHRFETSSTYGVNNGFDIQRPRALIDAYGSDERDTTRNQKLPHVKNLAMNGLDNKVGVQTWQNTEEEEFEWEDMSPTLADRDRSNNLFSSSILQPGGSKTRHDFGPQSSLPVKTEFSRDDWPNQEQLPSVNDASVLPDNAVPSVSSDHGLKRKITGLSNEPPDIPVSHYAQEAWNLSRTKPWAPQHHYNPQRNGVKSQIPFSASSSAHGQKPSPSDGFPVDVQHHLPSAPRSILSSMGMVTPEVALPTSTGAWRPPVTMHKTQPLPVLPSLPFQKHIRSQFDMSNASHSAVNDKKSLVYQQQLDTSDGRPLSKLSQFPLQQTGLVSNQQIPVPNTMFRPQLSLPQEVRPNMVPPGLAFNPSHLTARPPIRGYAPQRFDAIMNATMSPVPGMQSSVPMLRPGVGMPPLPAGPPPSLHMMPVPQLPPPVAPTGPAGPALSGLFSSLVAQGLISLTKPAPEQDSIPLEFDPDALKARHESSITALHADLPRQCKTCGLRFKLQEDHSNHMDWHVTKNRVLKNRKQKPSQKWFVNLSMWLSTAEALGTDSVPGFRLPSENVVEKKDDEEMAVPADEDQNVCALCGEPFDDFYSDETEEWMYRGAVYMNAPTGSTVGMDKSQLGPIVHAKCRSDSTVVPPDDFGKNGGVYTEEGSPMKRMRS